MKCSFRCTFLSQIRPNFTKEKVHPVGATCIHSSIVMHEVLLKSTSCWENGQEPLVPDSLPLSAALTILASQRSRLSLAVAPLHDVESKKAVVWPQEHFKKPKAVGAAAQVIDTHRRSMACVCLRALRTCVMHGCTCVCACVCVFLCTLCVC